MVIYNRVDTLLGWMSKKQGLFAEFFAVLGALNYAEQHQAAAVSVDFTSDIYLDKKQGSNWWDYFFEPVMTINPEIQNPKQLHYNKIFRYFGSFGWQYSWTKALGIKNPARRPYPAENANEVRNVNRLTARYIKLKPYLQEKNKAILVRK